MSVIVFDFFGVICSEVAPNVLSHYLPQDKAVEIKRTLVHKADLGLMTQDEFFARLAAMTGVPQARLEAEFQAHVHIDEAVVALIEDLRRCQRVALLTNALVPYVREILKRHDLERLFETILVSSEEHLAKPDPAFFLRLLQRMGVRPGDALMIDDNPENVAVAKGLGMQGIVFVSAEQLVKKLASFTGA